MFLVFLDGFTLFFSDFGWIYTGFFFVFLDGFALGVFSSFGWIYTAYF